MNLPTWPWKPDPDYTRLLKHLSRTGRSDFVPLLEFLVDPEIIKALSDGLFPGNPFHGRTPVEKNLDTTMWVYYKLGYDALRAKPILDLPFKKMNVNDTAMYSRGSRSWVNEGTGPITNWQEFEQYPWPSPADADCSQLEYVSRNLPEGMAILAKAYGIFEQATNLMGYQTFAESLYDQPDLIQAIFDRIEQVYLPLNQAIIQMERVIGLWIGDDMGFRTGTLTSPKHLRKFVFPIHKKIANACHEHGKLFLMHSCGNLSGIMDELIKDVCIDSKHSFEDAIQPVEAFCSQYGNRISVIGGVDVDLLARSTPQQIRGRVQAILKTCATTGSYMLGSGNSITNYVPVENFLAMIDEGWRFNQSISGMAG